MMLKDLQLAFCFENGGLRDKGFIGSVDFEKSFEGRNLVQISRNQFLSKLTFGRKLRDKSWQAGSWSWSSE